MLSDTEKAYCQALVALKQKDYEQAVLCFEKGIVGFGTNGEFNLLYQTTRLLLEVKKETANLAGDTTGKKEMTING